MTKAFKEGEAHYGASGHQPGGRVNFVAVGSSSMSNLGNDYYVQNFYDLPSYKKALDQNLLPSFRGLKLNDDDSIIYGGSMSEKMNKSFRGWGFTFM